MWSPEEFEKHWKNEFPDGEVPKMELNSMEDIERELEKCKTNLKIFQQTLAEEKFKVIYLQTTLARNKKSYDRRWDGSVELKEKLDTTNCKEATEDSNDKTGKADNHRRGISGLRKKAGSVQSGAPHPNPTASSSDPHGLYASVNKTSNKNIAKQENTEDASDHDYEEIGLNENFVKSNLMAPKIKLRETRVSNPHRGALKVFGDSKDFDSSDDGRLSPSGMPRRSDQHSNRGSGCSTPERSSDGYLSSDQEDSSSAGKQNTTKKQIYKKIHLPVL
ncbi:BCR protein, partial [Polyodon spathula]|nr:BCR protein [Polyodon spathula]